MKGVCAPGMRPGGDAPGRGAAAMRSPSSFLSNYDLGTYFKIIDAALISCDAFGLLKELILVFRD